MERCAPELPGAPLLCDPLSDLLKRCLDFSPMSRPRSAELIQLVGQLIRNPSAAPTAPTPTVLPSLPVTEFDLSTVPESSRSSWLITMQPSVVIIKLAGVTLTNESFYALLRRGGMTIEVSWVDGDKGSGLHLNPLLQIKDILSLDLPCTFPLMQGAWHHSRRWHL